MKKLLKIVLICFLALFLIGAGLLLYLTWGLEAGNEMEIGSVNPSILKDGTYTGRYNGGRWSNEVAVTITGGRITDIRIVRDVVIPQPWLNDELFSMVMEAQNTNVEAISGATVTSKAYLKAIENALTRQK